MVKKNPLQFALRGEGAAAVLFWGYPFRRDFRGGQSRLFFLFGIKWAQRREGDKIAKILRINRKKLMSVDIVFFDIIKKIEIRRAGAFVERMWLSKKKTFASELASVSLF